MKRNLVFYIFLICFFVLSACQEKELFVEVGFEANNDTQAETMIYSNQSFGFLPDDPIKDGYIFDGWYRDQGLTEPFDLKMIDFNAADFVVFAKWIQVEFELNIHLNNDDDNLSSNVLVGSALDFPDDLNKDGYTFDGWYTDNEFLTPLESEIMPNRDLDIYAKWVKSNYVLSFETNTDTSMEPIMIETGTMIELPENPVKSGYTFYGWYQDEALTIPFNQIFMPSEDLTLYARYTNSMFYYELDEENQATITGVISDTLSEFVEIPEIIDDYPVISISYEALQGHTNIQTLYLPDSLNYLPLGVLHDQVNLMSLKTPFVGLSRPDESNQVDIRNSILGSMFVPNYIEMSLFSEIYVAYQGYVPYSLMFLEITDSEILASHALSYTQISHLTLNEGLLEIEALAFYETNTLTNLTIPASLETIHDGAFLGMGNLYYFFVDALNPYFISNSLSNLLLSKDETILYAYASGKNNYFAEIPHTVTEIASFAFANSSVFSIVIPESVTLIDDYAFFDCNHLTELIFEDNSQLATIGAYAFSNTTLVSLVIPNQVTLIRNNAFERNFSLKSLVFESGSTIRTIGSQAFAKTYSLSEVILPISIEYLYSRIFYGDRDLVIYIEAETQPIGWNNEWAATILEENIIWGYVSD